MDPIAAHAELMARLSPPRLPDPTPVEALATGLAAFALGLALALLAAAALRLLVARRASPAEAARRALDAARDLPPARRLLAQARVVERLAREDAPRGRRRSGMLLLSRARRDRRREALSNLAEEIGAALYTPRPALDPDAADAAIRAVLKRA